MAAAAGATTGHRRGLRRRCGSWPPRPPPRRRRRPPRGGCCRCDRGRPLPWPAVAVAADAVIVAATAVVVVLVAAVAMVGCGHRLCSWPGGRRGRNCCHGLRCVTAVFMPLLSSPWLAFGVVVVVAAVGVGAASAVAAVVVIITAFVLLAAAGGLQCRRARDRHWCDGRVRARPGRTSRPPQPSTLQRHAARLSGLGDGGRARWRRRGPVLAPDVGSGRERPRVAAEGDSLDAPSPEGARPPARPREESRPEGGRRASSGRGRTRLVWIARRS